MLFEWFDAMWLQWRWVLVILFGWLFATGCSVSTDHNGTVGFEVSTRWVLIHETTTASEDTAKSKLVFDKSLMDWFFEDDGADVGDIPNEGG